MIPDEQYENPMETDDGSLILPKIILCVLIGLAFAICVLWASVNVANQIQQIKP